MSIPMALYYLKKGQSPMMTIFKNRSEFPLYTAAENGHISLLGLLFYYGADPNQRLFNGRTALHRCAQYAHLD